MPAHSSHFLQLMDATPLAVFKEIWHEELYHQTKRFSSQALQKRNFFNLFNHAWRKVIPSVIQRGFRETGIWPINMSIIPEDKYAPSNVLCPLERERPPVKANTGSERPRADTEPDLPTGETT